MTIAAAMIAVLAAIVAVREAAAADLTASSHSEQGLQLFPLGCDFVSSSFFKFLMAVTMIDAAGSIHDNEDSD